MEKNEEKYLDKEEYVEIDLENIYTNNENYIKNPINEKSITNNNKLNKINEIILKKNINKNQYLNQYIKTLFTVFFELYRAITSSLLVLFVPQNCNNQVCTINQNLEWDQQQFYNVVLIFNFITLSLFSILYIIEIIRERFLIEYLDVNINIPNDDLDVEKTLTILPIESKNKIIQIDKYYQIASYGSIIIYTANIILSFIIVKEYYLNSQTSFTFMTYVLFMFNKLSNIFNISNTKKHVFYSAYLKPNIQYNDIGEKYKK
jgi:hypothetical protein